MTAPTDRQDMTATADRAEPMASAEPEEPIDPMETAEPTLPMDSTEFFEPMDSTDPEDHRDIIERSIFCSLSLAAAVIRRIRQPSPHPSPARCSGPDRLVSRKC